MIYVILYMKIRAIFGCIEDNQEINLPWISNHTQCESRIPLDEYGSKRWYNYHSVTPHTVRHLCFLSMIYIIFQIHGTSLLLIF